MRDPKKLRAMARDALDKAATCDDPVIRDMLIALARRCEARAAAQEAAAGTATEPGTED